MLFGFDVFITLLVVGVVAAAKTKPGHSILKKAAKAVLQEEGVLLKLEAIEGKINQAQLEHNLQREPVVLKERDHIDELRYQQQVEVERTKLDTLKANRKLLGAESKRKLEESDLAPLDASYQELPKAQPMLAAPPPPLPRSAPPGPVAEVGWVEPPADFRISTPEYRSPRDKKISSPGWS